MTPAKKRKTSEADSNAQAVNNVPKAATLLAQAPAAVRATITVLANSPEAAQARRQRQPQVVPTTDAAPEPEPESEAPAEATLAAPVSRKAKRKKASKRKTLTSKGKRAVVLNVLASVEAQKRAAEAEAAAAAAAANTTTAPLTTNVQEEIPPEAKKNLRKAWTKAELTKLARLAEEKDYLLATIPDHPELTSNADLDWELISSHFGRYSKGGVAVRQQYYAVVRLMKQARKEGRNGSNYVDLVKQALTELPEQKGTVYEIQAVLKKDHAKHLDKYKVKGQVRWKKAVGEVLRQETSIFEAVEKTESGKIIWKLK